MRRVEATGIYKGRVEGRKTEGRKGSQRCLVFNNKRERKEQGRFSRIHMIQEVKSWGDCSRVKMGFRNRWREGSVQNRFAWILKVHG